MPATGPDEDDEDDVQTVSCFFIDGALKKSSGLTATLVQINATEMRESTEQPEIVLRHQLEPILRRHVDSNSTLTEIGFLNGLVSGGGRTMIDSTVALNIYWGQRQKKALYVLYKAGQGSSAGGTQTPPVQGWESGWGSGP
eukprot:2026304-Prymnesium_polylepis.1